MPSCLVLHSRDSISSYFGGLEPYFIDISIDDWYMDKTVLLDKIEELKEEVAIVVPYATFGSWMNLEEYEELEKSVPVVVDAAPGFGLMNGVCIMDRVLVE